MSMPECTCGHEVEDSGKRPDQFSGHVNIDHEIDIIYICMGCGQEYEATIPFSRFKAI